MELGSGNKRRHFLKNIGCAFTAFVGGSIVSEGDAQVRYLNALPIGPASLFIWAWSTTMPRRLPGRRRWFLISVTMVRAAMAAMWTPRPLIIPSQPPASAGGGIVFFPAGNYLCFSIHLASNITLYLDRGAVVIAAENGALGSYDAAESNAPYEAYQDYHHNHWHNSLIWGEGLTNIGIVGGGLFWGRGLSRGRSRKQAFCRRPGSRQQGHCPKELPQCRVSRLFYLKRRNDGHSRYRSR